MTFQNKKRILLREVMEDYLKDSPPKKDFIDTTNINFFSTEFKDPNGAPSNGRNFILAITNDGSNPMSGHINVEMIFRKLS